MKHQSAKAHAFDISRDIAFKQREKRVFSFVASFESLESLAL